MPITEVKEWNDLGFNELILSYTDSQSSGIGGLRWIKYQYWWPEFLLTLVYHLIIGLFYLK